VTNYRCSIFSAILFSKMHDENSLIEFFLKEQLQIKRTTSKEVDHKNMQNTSKSR